MTIYGYIRESFLKNPEILSAEEQKKLLEEKKVDVLIVEQAKPITNQTTTLDKHLKELKKGDQLWVAQNLCLGRDKKQLFDLHTKLKLQGVVLFCLDSPGKNKESDFSISDYLEWLNNQEKIVKEERRKSRIKQGILSGNGVGRKRLINDQLKNIIKQSLLEGEPKAQIARNLKISRVTLYRALNQLEKEKKT